MHVQIDSPQYPASYEIALSTVDASCLTTQRTEHGCLKMLESNTGSELPWVGRPQELPWKKHKESRRCRKAFSPFVFMYVV